MIARRLLSRTGTLVVRSRLLIVFIERRISELGYSKVESWWRFLFVKFLNVHLKCKI